MIKAAAAILLILGSFSVQAATGFASSEKMNVAVLEFDTKGDLGREDAGAIIAEWLVNALHKSQAFNLRESVLLKKVLEEQELGMSGRVDDATATKIGKIYGVEAIITGSVIKWGNIIYISARLIDTENGMILKTYEVETNDINDIRSKTDDLASIITGVDAGEEKELSGNEIDTNVDIAMKRFSNDVKGAKEFIKLAKGILILPNVVKGGMIIGYEYGLGALRIDGKTTDYYKVKAGSFGLQLGIQKKDIIIGFMTDDALEEFRKTAGWQLGIDSNLSLEKAGEKNQINVNEIKNPVVAFAFEVSGLLLDVSLKGLKFTRVVK
jgi:lipid-binding SYLF domain-containing protein/TolB-like protein